MEPTKSIVLIRHIGHVHLDNIFVWNQERIEQTVYLSKKLMMKKSIVMMLPTNQNSVDHINIDYTTSISFVTIILMNLVWTKWEICRIGIDTTRPQLLRRKTE